MELRNTDGEAIWAETTTVSVVKAVIGVQEESSGITWKIGAAATVATSAGAIYTPPSGVQAIVGTASFFNTSAVTQFLVVYLRKSGTNYEWFQVTLAENEKAQYDYRSGWTVLDADGLVKTSTVPANAGDAFPAAVYHGKPWYRTDLNAAFWYDTDKAKWLGEMEHYQFGRNGNLVSGNFLRFGGNVIAGNTTSAPPMPYPMTIVGLTASHDSLPTAGDLIVGEDAVDLTKITTDLVEDRFRDMTLDVDFADFKRMSIKWGTFGGGASPATIVDTIVVVYARRHET